MPKVAYVDMIATAILHLADRSGSSRDAIWKYLQMKFPEDITEKRIFLARLLKISKESKHVEKVPGNT
jgi:hypothetical protein